MDAKANTQTHTQTLSKTHMLRVDDKVPVEESECVVSAVQIYSSTCGAAYFITAIRTISIAITHPVIYYTRSRTAVETVRGACSRARGRSMGRESI